MGKKVFGKLQIACQDIQANSKFVKLARGSLDNIINQLNLSEELVNWYTTLAPVDVTIRWTANQLTLFDPRKLMQYQVGYRWIENEEKKVVDDWHKDWVVIGWVGGDPVIAHVDRANTPISMALHGIGYWKPDIIADNLFDYLEFIVKWCELIKVYDGVHLMYDDNGELHNEVITRLNILSKSTVGEKLAPNLRKYLIG